MKLNAKKVMNARYSMRQTHCVSHGEDCIYTGIIEIFSNAKRRSTFNSDSESERLIDLSSIAQFEDSESQI
jgi:hypothetical protein